MRSVEVGRTPNEEALHQAFLNQDKGNQKWRLALFRKRKPFFNRNSSEGYPTATLDYHKLIDIVL
jgi:hypothetical protein